MSGVMIEEGTRLIESRSSDSSHLSHDQLILEKRGEVSVANPREACVIRQMLTDGLERRHMTHSSSPDPNPIEAK